MSSHPSPIVSKPYKTLFITSQLLLLPTRYLYWTLRNLLPSWRPYPSWPLSRALGASLIRWALGTFWKANGLTRRDPTVPTTAKELEGSDGRMVWCEAVDVESLTGEIGRRAREVGVRGQRVQAHWVGLGEAGVEPPPEGVMKRKVVLHFHGGVYITGSALPSDITVFFAVQSPKHSSTIRASLLVEYRLSSSAPNPSENPFPAAIVDAIASYRYLRSLGYVPKEIIIVGDSAGGNLAVALVKYLVEEEHTEGELGDVLLLSPWVDFTPWYEDPSSSFVRNYRTDFLAAWETGMLAYCIRSYCGDASPHDAWISPGCGTLDPEPSYAGWPRCYVLAGGGEMLVDEIRRLVGRMRKGCRELVYDEVPEAPHDMLSMWFMEPERTVVLKKIIKWMDDSAPDEI